MEETKSMSSESYPKDFEKSTEVLPFTAFGLTTFAEFKAEEKQLQHLEWLKRAGLSSEEIKLYQDYETGIVDQHKKQERSVLKSKLDVVYNKIKEYQTDESSKIEEEPSTSRSISTYETFQKEPLRSYPPDHPINNLKEIEKDLFGHLQDPILPINKRRKLLRRLERKKQRMLEHKTIISMPPMKTTNEHRLGSLWDVMDNGQHSKTQNFSTEKKSVQSKVSNVDFADQDKLIGPRKQTMYTVKDNKIVRLEPITANGDAGDNVRAVEIVVPTNRAEERLLEGTKMCADDIKNIERFKDYKPGAPSKVLYIKNIPPSVSQEQLALLFNQFTLDNGAPVDVRLMAGRMRGQAFVCFQNEDVAMQALDEIHGTILGGKPLVVQFGRNSNRIQGDHT